MCEHTEKEILGDDCGEFYPKILPALHHSLDEQIVSVFSIDASGFVVSVLHLHAFAGGLSGRWAALYPGAKNSTRSSKAPFNSLTWL